MKVYVTKYALSMGIKECEVVGWSGQYVHASWPNGVGGKAMFTAKEYARTKEDAAAQADEMRKAKIASVKKQLAKLEAMTF